MEEAGRLAVRFEEQRPQLRAVAYRMPGSLTGAGDAVQNSWLWLFGAGAGEVENLAGWLTTVVARECLKMLRARRRRRREEPLGGHVPGPVIGRPDGADPGQEALLAGSAGLALLVVLDTLAPAGRLAFVLHGMFGVPFGQIAPIVGRTPAAARQAASRARRRVHAAAPVPGAGLARQQEVVAAFLAAARGGDFEALVAALDPDVVLRADAGAAPAGASRVVRGAPAVAGLALSFGRRHGQFARLALVNGAAGIVAAVRERPVPVLGVTVRGGKIAEIGILAGPARLRPLDLTSLGN